MRSDARSDPASGSEKPWHHTLSPRRIGGRYRARWSGVPSAAIVGPACRVDTKLQPTYGAPAFSVSSRKISSSDGVAPRPPYSFGHEMPAYPASNRRRCQPVS